MSKSNVYLAMQKIVNRLRNKDGTFDGESLFAIGVILAKVNLSQEEIESLSNPEVILEFKNCEGNKIKNIRLLRDSLLVDIGLQNSKEVIEGKRKIVVSLEVAKTIKKRCEEVGAVVDYN